MARLFCLLFLMFAQVAVSAPPAVGDEVAGEAFVIWFATVEKTSGNPGEGLKVKSKLMFRGRTQDGTPIRGNGKLRFAGRPNEEYLIGQQLKGNDSLQYWATVKHVMGGGLVILKGSGVLDVMTSRSALPTQGGVEFEAGMDSQNNF